jgi:hypothetical protein
VRVVDDKHERLLEFIELGQKPLCHHRAREPRRRTDPLNRVVAGGVGEGVYHLKPESLRVAQAALDGDPRYGLFRPRGPRAQQHGLPASRGCADERDGTRSRS